MGKINNFEYCVSTRVVFGADSVDKLPELISKEERVLITYGKGSIKSSGLYDRVKALLGSHLVGEFGGICANPDFDHLMKCVDVVKDIKPTLLLAVGGGSVLDGTKFIAVASAWTYTKDPYDILSLCGDANPDPKCVPSVFCPVASIMTLPATGSECNNGGVISCRRLGTKLGFSAAAALPVFSVLDPKLTYTLPRHQIANGLADSFVHVMEQYTAHSDCARLQDEQCEGLLRSIVDVAPSALECDHPDYHARSDYFWCATQALNGLVGCGVPQCWGTHYIGHELTVQYGLDHGLTLAIVMPRFLKKLIPQRKKKLARMAVRVWGISSEGKSEEQLAQEAIDSCEKWFNSLGLKTTLSGNGCGGEHIDEIASKFKEFKLGPEKLIGEKEVKEILIESL